MIRVAAASGKAEKPLHLINGRYLLVEEIGKGRTASVHRAWDREKSTQVAVKLPIIPECLLAKEIFENERNALGQVRHPNIVEIFDSGESELGNFIVLELIEGACLRDLLAARKLELGKRLRALREVCGALEALHRAGIVHRDVKPRNIMIAEDGSAKLLDFGYANVRRSFCCQYLRKDRFGSPFYSAPELTRESADPKLDIYSLGMMAFEMLLQHSAFRLMSAIRMLEVQHSLLHLKRQVVKGRIPKLAGELIESAVDRDPEKRAGAEDFLGTLRQLIEEVERL